MHVLVNGLSTSGVKTGIGHYTAQLLRSFAAQAGGDVIESFPSPWLWKARSLGRRIGSWLGRSPTASAEVGLKQGPAVKPSAEPAPSGLRTWCGLQARSFSRTFLEVEFRLRRWRGAPDLYHEPNSIPLPTDVPTVVTVHDLSVLLHPEWHPAVRVAGYEERFRRGLAQCRHVITDSEFIRQELVHILGVDPAKTTCAPLGVRPGLGPMSETEVRATLHRLGLPPRYFLYLGTIEPRKNVLTLMRAYVKLPAEVRERYPLLLVGGWGWNSGEVAAYLDGEARHRGVIYTGYLPDQDLAAVLNGARALVYPSFYEGFGLPPVEMMACGGAVLCSTAGTLVETVGARAHLVESLDEDGWREALHRTATDDEWHAELRRGVLDLVRPYTWERCAAATLAVYRVVCGHKENEGRPLRKAA